MLIGSPPGPYTSQWLSWSRQRWNAGITSALYFVCAFHWSPNHCSVLWKTLNSVDGASAAAAFCAGVIHFMSSMNLFLAGDAACGRCTRKARGCTTYLQGAGHQCRDSGLVSSTVSLLCMPTVVQSLIVNGCRGACSGRVQGLIETFSAYFRELRPT